MFIQSSGYMEEFKIIPPGLLLKPYIRNYWLLKTTSHSVASTRTVPTGMMNLIFHRANRLWSIHDNNFHPRAFLSGQEKTFFTLNYTGEVNMISVVFHPAGAKAFFHLPLIKIQDSRLTAQELEDKELLALERSILHTEDDHTCILLIEQFLLKRLIRFPEYNHKRIEIAISLINSGQTDISALADATCMSTKQFNRIFSEYVGSNPKEFTRIVRFQKALHILKTQPQISLTDLTYCCGYFDQSHLIKEFKLFSGYTPTQYLTNYPPHSDYFS